MSELPQSPHSAGPDSAGPGDAAPVRPFDASLAAAGVSLAIVAGTALLGVAAGYVWSQAAPRALLVIVSPGAAGLVQTETAAFIVADLTFCLIGLAGGVVSGAVGYLLGVRRYGPLAMIGVLAGALAAALLARWVGQQSGAASFHHLLATLPVGGHLLDTLTLRATGAIACWPFAAGLTAGGMEAVAIRGRHRGRASQPLLAGPGPGAGGSWPPGSPPGLPGPQPGLD
jgi:hypothetical protein